MIVACIKVTTGKEFHMVQAAWNVKESKRGFHKVQATSNLKKTRAGAVYHFSHDVESNRAHHLRMVPYLKKSVID